MRPRLRKRRSAVAIAAGVVTFGLVLTGCTDASDPDGEGSFDFSGKEVGAMSDFTVGTTFKATEPVEFSMLYRDHEAYPLKEDWPILTALDANQNVSFDFEVKPRSDWAQARSTVIAAGESPEIVTVSYPGEETQFVAGGALLPVSDFVQYMPNYQDKVEKWGLQGDLDNLRQADGKYYILPSFAEILRPQYTYAVRADIFTELGLSLEPKTFDEFAEELEAVKKAYPDKFPISDRWTDADPLGATLNFAAPSFGTNAGWGYGDGTWWNGSEFVYTGATDEYKNLISYYAGLVSDGLMDPASVGQSDDQAKAKFANSESFVIATNDQEILTLRSALTEVGNTDAEVAMIRVPGGPAGENLQAGGRLGAGILLSSKAAESEHFKALLQFVDWLYYSDEGLEFAKWGVEGEQFTKSGDTRTFTADWDRNGLNPGAPKALNVDGGFSNGVFMGTEGSTSDLLLSMAREETVDFINDMVSTKTQLPSAPAAPLTDIEQEQASIWRTALKDHVWQATAQFITGQRPLSEWDAYVSELEGLNLQQYIDLVNSAQKRQADALAGGGDEK
ncbi:extracellular solute-binding protein [Protaetiibacter larvae]|uniref:Extracellular solute-binding protein n=2 Tax=Protaetiibacter larvae TaxID=2592654 RepID=A0A5C1YB11_9MICO|nr:extracellular solute-binding protein [Protaetiibacter larvae]